MLWMRRGGCNSAAAATMAFVHVYAAVIVDWLCVRLQLSFAVGGCAAARSALPARLPCPCCRPPNPHFAADAFRQCPLFIGGPVTKNLLHVLHARRDVEGALEILEVSCW